MSNADNRDESASSNATTIPWGLVMVALPLLYVLSIGPASALHARVEILQQPLETMYYPLSLLLETKWGSSLEPYLSTYME
ncbi:MAG: hypothetical protein O2955_11335 [Planctomycetota bacterium]|nr:hypothetical protein [Planctomycetota bacterium]MDA1213106.1 hypothetical protein [Planctomycetota bacterium]